VERSDRRWRGKITGGGARLQMGGIDHRWRREEPIFFSTHFSTFSASYMEISTISKSPLAIGHTPHPTEHTRLR
jgi:hypothetical protein